MKVELGRSITRAFIKGYTWGTHRRDPEDYFNNGLVLSVAVILDPQM